MDLAVLLLILRLAGAFFLFAFLGLIAWLIYQDIRSATVAVAEQQRHHGVLRLLATADGQSAEAEARFPLLPVTSIGRAPGNTVVLDDDYVSNEHALLMLRGGQWWVEDLNSRNGTFLNGAQLEEATIVSAGDVLTIGQSELKLEPAAADEQD